MTDEFKFNIKYNNNKLFYTTPNKWYKQIVIPPALYEYEQLNDEVINQLKKKS